MTYRWRAKAHEFQFVFVSGGKYDRKRWWLLRNAKFFLVSFARRNREFSAFFSFISDWNFYIHLNRSMRMLNSCKSKSFIKKSSECWKKFLLALFAEKKKNWCEKLCWKSPPPSLSLCLSYPFCLSLCFSLSFSISVFERLCVLLILVGKIIYIQVYKLVVVIKLLTIIVWLFILRKW